MTQAVLAFWGCVYTQPVLAIPEMEYKLVLVCISRLPKTNMGVTVLIDEKNSENFLINRKVFCIFTIYYNKGAE